VARIPARLVTAGYSGKSGYSGRSGFSGYSGAGTSGFSGYSGAAGGAGGAGTSGFSGYSGISGFSGYSGISGFSGYSGKSGYSGISGYSGYSGFASKTILGVNGGTGSLTAIPASSTFYTAPFDVDLAAGTQNTIEANVAFALPYAGTAKNLFVRTSDAAVGGTSLTVTTRKNAADTALTVGASTSANTSTSDTTHTVAFAQGDRMTISLVANGTGTNTAGIASIALEYDSP
jgi:hypothetical protein